MDPRVDSSGAAARFGGLDWPSGVVGLADLAAQFRQGRSPVPLPSGEHAGRLLALELGPLTGAASALARAWMPWRGKWFDPDRRVGTNLLSRDSLPLVHLIWPTYRGIEHLRGPIYRAFAFSIEQRPSLLDPDQRVLAIDYRRPDNPRLGVRQVTDELVELGPGLYLGQAILRLPLLPGTSLRRVAFFALARRPVA